jgi:Zn finger protein HypA/HybF involved in hydrogenase expression
MSFYTPPDLYGSLAPLTKVTPKVKLECLECGKKFTRSVKALKIGLRCPKCTSEDVDIC